MEKQVAGGPLPAWLVNGRLTETTAAVYRYSIWHTLSLFVTHPLAGLALWLGTRKYRASRV